ncbi:MAG: hypothetical protein WCP98_05195 [Actinomycetes bacterium]
MNVPASGDTSIVKRERRAATPIAGAIAGILFAVLFGVSTMLMNTTMSNLSDDTGAWLETGVGRLKLALELLPFAGLFFLWFIAVARERLGRFEDQFFSTIFLGSGLLFLAMMFAAAASAGALVAAYAHDPTGFAASSGYFYARQIVAQIFGIYALKMAAIFLISQATLWVRTGVMPRWMALLTYALALVLLFIFTQSPWIILVFPAWVLMVSVYILVTRLAGDRPAARDDTPRPQSR